MAFDTGRRRRPKSADQEQERDTAGRRGHAAPESLREMRLCW